MVHQISTNLEFKDPSSKKAKGETGGQNPTVEQVTDEFVKQTSFYNQAIVREQIFNL